MKNSQPMMKKRIMPVMMSEKDSFNPHTVEISPAPDCKNVIRKAVKII